MGLSCLEVLMTILWEHIVFCGLKEMDSFVIPTSLL